MIYVSTGGYKDISFKDAIKILSQENINAFELSGGIYTETILEDLKLLSSLYSISLHNYFPPAKESFVFNLGSLNDSIASQSINHAKKAIEYASIINSNFYSFHAGYLIDPMVDELGKKINRRTVNDRDLAKSLFIERVNDLSQFAKSQNIKLLIENNVLSLKNFQEFQDNPLLMVESKETNEILENTDDNVGLLIDVAHLKVSANTLDFSAKDYLVEFKDVVSAYHLSDNNGFEDSNNILQETSWFWDYINKSLDYYSLELYNLAPSSIKQQLELTEKKIY